MRADVARWREDRDVHQRLLDLARSRSARGSSAGLCTVTTSPLVRVTTYSTLGAVARDVEVVLALQPLLDDLHVQQAQEAAAEAEAQRHRVLRLEDERGVVELQPVQRVAQQRIVVALHREEAGEDHRLGGAVAGQRLGGGRAASVMVSPTWQSLTFLKPVAT